ncbi:MAG TPA: methyltransferase domain-containing protein [Castellaniella sp.]|uniref:class I SAM-dependent methyltransferase n=1 Tax=Castellaniella sp. TaxID=1955812 RepID=UPI002F1893F5
MLKMTGMGTVQLLEGLRTLQAYSVTGIRGLRRVVGSTSPGLFLHEWLAQPGIVGSVWPSSRGLARHMVQSIDPHGDGLVVELGAGTGAVTQALIDHGVSVDRLRVVERSPAFVQHLRKRFPAVTVVQGDATELDALLPQGIPVDAVVSSLPLRSLNVDDVRAIEDQWRALVRPGGLVTQFTYALHGRAPDFDGDFVQCGRDFVLGNLPPAKVMTFVRLAR